MTAADITAAMMAKDRFSQWLGLEVVMVNPGECVLSMRVREEMVNGLGVAHGGITFSLADSAMAFASNGQGRHAVSIDNSISHLMPVRVGDVLTARATEENLGGSIGHYRVVVFNQEGQMVALFRGIVFRKGPWGDGA